MVDRYTVTGTALPSVSLSAGAVGVDGSGNGSNAQLGVRSYYIAADEVEWDYAPLGGMGCSDDGTVTPFEDDPDATTYLGQPNGTRIGSRWGCPSWGTCGWEEAS